MRALRTVAAAVLSMALLFSAQPAQAAPTSTLPPVAGPVSIPRYMGTWHQVAGIPAVFQLQCVANTTARYSLNDDGSVEVVNSCTTWIGTTSTARGVATVQNPVNNAELQVRFPFVEPISGRPTGTNYVITYLNADYSLAIVGDPRRSFGWVLSRTPALGRTEWNLVESIVAERGFNPCSFLISPTTGGRVLPVPLCWI